MKGSATILVTGSTGKLGGYLVRESQDVIPVGNSFEGLDQLRAGETIRLFQDE